MPVGPDAENVKDTFPLSPGHCRLALRSRPVSIRTPTEAAAQTDDHLGVGAYRGNMAHPQMFDDDDPVLERVRTIALSLPEAQEKVSHGRPAFFTTKVFAHFGGARKCETGEIEQHPHAVLVLLDPMDAEVVLEQPDSFVPMYLGPSGWIGVEVEELSDDELRDLLVDSYRSTASATLLRSLPETE